MNGLSSLSRRTPRRAGAHIAAAPAGGPRAWLAWCARPPADARAALLRLLALPLLSLVPAFLLAVGLTAGGAPAVGTLRSGVAGLAYVYLTLCVMWLPAYGAGLLWFWWRTRDGDDDRLLGRLYLLPPVAALFMWFPSLAFIALPLLQKLKAYPMLGLSAVVAGYLWIGLVRLIYFIWRRQ